MCEFVEERLCAKDNRSSGLNDLSELRSGVLLASGAEGLIVVGVSDWKII